MNKRETVPFPSVPPVVIEVFGEKGEPKSQLERFIAREWKQLTGRGVMLVDEISPVLPTPLKVEDYIEQILTARWKLYCREVYPRMRTSSKRISLHHVLLDVDSHLSPFSLARDTNWEPHEIVQRHKSILGQIPTVRYNLTNRERKGSNSNFDPFTLSGHWIEIPLDKDLTGRVKQDITESTSQVLQELLLLGN